MKNKWTAFTRFLEAEKEYFDKRAEAEGISVFTVAKDGYGTEPHPLRFSTYEDAERIAVKFIRGGFTNVAIMSQSPVADEKRTAELKRLERRYHEAKALRYQPDES